MHMGRRVLASAPALAPAGMANLSRLSVLVADGDAAQGRRTLDLLGGLDVRDVICVQDRDSALAWLRSRAFDVLLCSYRLGEHDGVELVRQARRVSPATRPILVRPHSRAVHPDGIETLERPFSSAKLQALLSRTAAPLGGLWCEVPQLSLTDILQMYHQGRRSITVLLSGPVAGRICLHEGELVHAESENLEGLPALSRLLEADSGLLRTEASTLDGPRSLHAPFESSILAAVQLLDERQRDRANAASAPASHTLSDPRPGSVPSPAPEFSEQPPSPRAKPGPLAIALASALLLIVVTFVFLAGNFAVTDRGQPQAPSPVVQSDVRGLAAREASPPALPPANPVIAEAPDPLPVQVEQRTSFVLTITSKPSRARVLERGNLLGKTPLTLSIPKESVARAPRELTLEHPGHARHVIRQGDSDQDVETAVALRPLAARDEDVLDADTLEPARRSERRAPRVRKRNLDIRLRR